MKRSRIRTFSLQHFIQRIVLLLSGILLFSDANAGWVLTGRYIDREGRTILQRMFIQDNKIKFEQFDVLYTFDLINESIILVDPVKLVYHQSTLTEYIANYQSLKRIQLEQLLNTIPEDQQSTVRQEYEKEIIQFGNLRAFTDSLSISRVSDTLKALGLPTERYLATVNKLKVEEIWIAPGLDVQQHISWDRYFHYLSVVAPDMYLPSYCFSEGYLGLLNKGFPVRRIIIESGYRTEIQVNRREEKLIQDYEFGPPDLCRKVGFTEWINRLPELEMENDDYE